MNTDEIRAEWSGDEREIATVVGELCDDVDRRTAQVRKLRAALEWMVNLAPPRTGEWTHSAAFENYKLRYEQARAALDETEEA